MLECFQILRLAQLKHYITAFDFRIMTVSGRRKTRLNFYAKNTEGRPHPGAAVFSPKEWSLDGRSKMNEVLY